MLAQLIVDTKSARSDPSDLPMILSETHLNRPIILDRLSGLCFTLQTEFSQIGLPFDLSY